MRKALLFSLIIFITTLSIIGNTGCANIIPPEGGPRDTLPPQLVNAQPEDSTVNFNSRRITLNFNEYIELKDLPNNTLFTPIFDEPPRISVRLKTVTLAFRDSLEPNTTYTLNFGNAIQDINEYNILRNFVYTFSTGPVMDSLELNGRVIVAETGRVDTTLMVMLYRKLNDSAVLRENPRYITRLDSDGAFHFRNLPSGIFKIYAMGGSGTRRRYREDELFAFYNDSVVIGNTDSVLLHAYKEKQSQSIQTPPLTNAAAAKDNRLRYTSNTTNNQLDLQKDLTLSFQTPLRKFDSAKIALSTDSTFKPVAFKVSTDTSRKLITVNTLWQEGTLYHLILDKDFAEDTAGKKLLRNDTLSFSIKKTTDYGQLNIRIRNLDNSRNPVLLFVQNDQVVFTAPLKAGVFTSPLFVPGDYDLRILYDKNGNGTWDPGQFFGTKRQPELVQPIQQKITVRPSWENEFERSL